jgi:hypothetical protein
MLIRSTSYYQDEIIESILKLYCPGGIDLDPTYSKGVFYKKAIAEPRLKFDINPAANGVVKACATKLPLEAGAVNSIMFDPPFLATTGASLKVSNDSNAIAKRFGVFKSETDLHEFYFKALTELFRVCKKDGYLIFKCQDKVSSGKQYFSHCFIYEAAIKIGWYPRDLFVLLAKSRLTPAWQVSNQKHARKFHSYFWVFQKKKRKISYLLEKEDEWERGTHGK